MNKNIFIVNFTFVISMKLCTLLATSRSKRINLNNIRKLNVLASFEMYYALDRSASEDNIFMGKIK